MRRFISIIFLLVFSFTAQAQNVELNETLVRIINQLNVITPLLDEAKSQTKSHVKVQIHIDDFKDNLGRNHLGLKSELQAIRAQLIAFINDPNQSPNTVKPLKHDFVSTP